MSDQFEETVRTVRELELKHDIGDMRAVHLEDGRNTIVEIQMRNEFGEWSGLSVGLARRRKGDRRDAPLGNSLALYRALANLTERHREQFAQRWPEYFPKTPKEVRDARAAVRSARAEVAAAKKQTKEALELLESSAEAFTGPSANIKAAISTLRGDGGKLPRSLGMGEGPADLSEREGFDA